MGLYFKKERDRDFFNVCETIRKESNAYLSISEIASRAVYREAKSFYLSDHEYTRIYYAARLYPRLANCRIEIKNEMYREIRARFLEAKHENPGMKHSKIAEILSSQTAPRFYMSEKSAVALYYRLLRKSE